VPVEIVGLERLEHYSQIAKVIEAQDVEAIVSNPDIKTFAPVVGNAFINDPLASLKMLDAIRTRSERWFKRRVCNIAPLSGFLDRLPPMFRQYGELSDDQR
jgi:hypothetical protein